MSGSLRFIFQASGLGIGGEPWVSDGTSAGTQLLADIFPGERQGSAPQQFTPLGDGRLLFIAYGTAAMELWTTDGTPAGTGPVPLAPSFGPNNLTALAPGLVLLTLSSPSTGLELWATDGTAAGTRLVSDIAPGPANNAPQDLTPIGGGLALFMAATSSTGSELWITDGTAEGTRLVKDIAAGSSYPSGFVPLGNGITVFRARTEDTGFELWATEGTPDGTILLGDIRPGGDSSFPYNINALGNGRAGSAPGTGHPEPNSG